MVAQKMIRLLAQERSCDFEGIRVYETVKDERDGLIPVVYSRRPDGSFRTSRPVLVNNTLFTAATDANDYLENRVSRQTQGLVNAVLGKVQFGETVGIEGYSLRYPSYDEVVEGLKATGAKPVSVLKVASVASPAAPTPAPTSTSTSTSMSPDAVRAMVKALDDHEEFAKKLNFEPLAGKFEISGNGFTECTIVLTADDAQAMRDFLLERKRNALRVLGVAV